MKKLVMQSEHWAHGLPMSAYYALMHNRVDISSRQDLHALAQSGELIQVGKGTVNSGASVFATSLNGWDCRIPSRQRNLHDDASNAWKSTAMT